MVTTRELYDRYCELSRPDKEWQYYDSISTTGDNNVRYKAEFTQRIHAAVFDVDGKLLKDEGERKCDKVLLAECPGTASCYACFIEMKAGRNIERAGSQLENTIRNELFRASNFVRREAVLVCGSMPKNKPGGEFQQIQRRLMALKCPLRRQRSGETDRIDVSKIFGQ